METKKTLMISTEKARKLYKNGNEDIKSLLLESFSKEELEQSKLPKTWEEYCENHYRIGYYLSQNSIIKSFTKEVYNAKLKSESDKNTLESIENAEAILALCQSIRLRDEYNGHKPINYEEEHFPYVIVNDYGYYKIVAATKHKMYKRLFVFHNEKLAQEFLKNFRPLLDKFYKIMY